MMSTKKEWYMKPENSLENSPENPYTQHQRENATLQNPPDREPENAPENDADSFHPAGLRVPLST
jgi:hypothetical protein